MLASLHKAVGRDNIKILSFELYIKLWPLLTLEMLSQVIHGNIYMQATLHKPDVSFSNTRSVPLSLLPNKDNIANQSQGKERGKQIDITHCIQAFESSQNPFHSQYIFVST